MPRRRLLLILGLLLLALPWVTRQGAAPVLGQQAEVSAPAEAPPGPAAVALPGTDDHAAGEADAGHGHEHFARILLALVLILIGAKLGAELFERLGQPAVLGEIIVGVLLGNLGLIGIDQLEFLHTDETVLILAEVGVVLLLFEVGLESNVQEMARVGVSSLLVALIGVITPFFLGWGVAHVMLPDEWTLTHAFVGATLTATSVGITARVLKDMGQLQRQESRIILGAAVIDDVLGLMVLAVMTGIIAAANTGVGISAGAIVLILVKSIGFLIGALVVGGLLSERLFELTSRLRAANMLLVTALGVCFLFSWLAGLLGLAPIVGAFAAGLVMDEAHYRSFTDRGERSIEHVIHPIGAVLIPIFFVVTGAKVQLAAMANPSILGFAAALTVVAILSKQACGLGVLQRNLNRAAVGLGMIPRGEVGLIFAGIGLQMWIGAGADRHHVVNESVFGAVVAMVMITTLVTPPLLKWSMSRDGGGASAAPSLRDGDGHADRVIDSAAEATEADAAPATADAREDGGA